MAELYFYSVMTSVPSGTIRFGWVSATTGITYCGICLRSPVAPRVGEECKACGARVAQLLDIRAKGDAWRQTWRAAASMLRNSDHLQATRSVVREVQGHPVGTET
jgi:hypothetical protein